MAAGGPESRSRRKPAGLLITRATIIISQPTRLPGWRAMIRAASTENTTGTARPQPRTWTASTRVGGPARWIIQRINRTIASTTAMALNAQARMRLFLLFTENPSPDPADCLAELFVVPMFATPF
jgi:hypothetical protein